MLTEDDIFESVLLDLANKVKSKRHSITLVFDSLVLEYQLVIRSFEVRIDIVATYNDSSRVFWSDLELSPRRIRFFERGEQIAFNTVHKEHESFGKNVHKAIERLITGE
jgi:hypothetical protein